MANMEDRTWIAALSLAVLLLTTSSIWFRLRRMPSMRPWLLRHMIGNLVLAIGLITAWACDLAPFYYIAIAIGVFAMWVWGTWRLRESIQKAK